MLLVKGGDTKGSTMMALINHLTILGKLILVTEKANKKPNAVPLIPTAEAKIRLFMKAFLLYQLLNTLFKTAKLTPPSEKNTT
jgi:hypothetical protein